MNAEAVTAVAATLFVPGGALHGRYDPPIDTPFVPIVGTVAGWQAPVFPVGAASSRILRVYSVDAANGDLVQAHWRNEVRALLRLSSAEHASLPQFREASFLAQQRMGFVVLDDPGAPVIGGHPLRNTMAARIAAAFRNWFSLVEAVALVQDEGIVHRSITPLSACALATEDARVVLDGFQMSAFVSAWLNRPRLDGVSPWLAQLDGQSLACLAPERAGPLAGRARRLPEGFRSDVFGLGMLGVLWLTPLAADFCAGFTAAQYSEARHHEVVAAARSRLSQSGLPRSLQGVLEQMMSFEPSNRIPSARAAYDEVARLYGVILRDFAGREPTQAAPRAVHYLKETMDRLYEDMHVRSSPPQPDYQEYSDFIARDLADGVLVWSPEGFLPWDSATKDIKASQARIVLLGNEYAYFAQYRDQGQRSETDSALVIKYVLSAHKARDLRSAAKSVPVPDLLVQFFVVGGGFTRPLPPSPGWRSLVASVETSARELAKVPVVRAANWLLDAQRAVSAAQEYRFSRDASDPNVVVLREHDEPIEIDETSEDDVLLALHRQLVRTPPMGVFFESVHRRAEEDGEQASFEWSEGRGGRAHATRLTFEKRLDDHTARFRSDLPAIALVPGEGYVRPADGTRSVLQRQRRAVLDLEMKQRHLAAQLMAPHAVRLRDESTVNDTNDDAGKLVRQVRETWPFFTVQGPPGTGKTYVAARLVQDLLREDPFVRLLVSAQSHHALDNLLEVVARNVDRDEAPILLRLASQQTYHKVSGSATFYTPSVQRERLIEHAKTPADSAVVKRYPTLSKRWRKALRDQQVDADLAQRLARSASVVFAARYDQKLWISVS